MSHKFAVGQVVVFVPDDGGAAANLAAMATIIRLLPMATGVAHLRNEVPSLR